MVCDVPKSDFVKRVKMRREAIVDEAGVSLQAVTRLVLFIRNSCFAGFNQAAPNTGSESDRKRKS